MKSISQPLPLPGEGISQHTKALQDNFGKFYVGEHWKSVIPHILARVEVEILHDSCLSHTMLEAKDNTDGNLILSLLILEHIVPDARCRPDRTKIIVFVKKECSNLTSIVENGENLTPYILLVGDVKSHSQVILVIDKINN